jgi:hypothetical protein
MEFTILTRSGRYFDFTKPHEHDFVIEDIADALANICRFNGHCPFYSVAQHSVAVSWLVPQEYAMEGLMHDAAEAYLGDVTAPLKMLLAKVYGPIEDATEAAIATRFGLKEPKHPSIKIADLGMLKLEHKKLFARYEEWAVTRDIPCAPDHLLQWMSGPSQARDMFLSRFLYLRGIGL